MLEEKDGKINDYNEIFAFFQGWKKTMNKRCDNLNYLVQLRARRQLLLERERLGSPGVSGWLEKWQVTRTTFFFFYATQAHRSSAKKTNCRSNFLWRGKFVGI